MLVRIYAYKKWQIGCIVRQSLVDPNCAVIRLDDGSEVIRFTDALECV